MNSTTFNDLTALVLDSPPHPPRHLFSGGYADWRCRARLAHFLISREDRQAEGIELFESIADIDIDDNDPEGVEEKVFALQILSAKLRETKTALPQALNYINQAIELAESTDYLYKYVLRGELWADRWLILREQQQTDLAVAEIDEKINAYGDIPIDRNSYLYFAYRFKAQLAAKEGLTLIAKDYMHKALSYMDIPAEYQEGLLAAFEAPYENPGWILVRIDQATPRPDSLAWDI